MKHGNTLRLRGFTLVEILIVVTILGILAAIVIPKFTNASDEARSTTTKALLKTLRNQLELYKQQHGDEYPALVDLWDNMTLKTDADHSLNVNGNFGPYLQQPPVNQYTTSSVVKAIGAGTASDGWEYDEDTGEINAVGFNETTGTYTAP